MVSNRTAGRGWRCSALLRSHVRRCDPSQSPSSSFRSSVMSRHPSTTHLRCGVPAKRECSTSPHWCSCSSVISGTFLFSMPPSYALPPTLARDSRMTAPPQTHGHSAHPTPCHSPTHCGSLAPPPHQHHQVGTLRHTSPASCALRCVLLWRTIVRL